ncbi:beta-ketoacyl-[acyl-carrier-protein] synthase family protein [Streptomyces sp. SL13]|uniref:Beta-ketoacyl-[acyl-carrier-protein] synthase family protein n=1 Tax=Streptantibioticus silvisoli TaxID=2705255 RepID=A0AA90H5Z4_9ACTN|nr:beta-ketoacyl-[acyl-carrier-protein] synthase family protein [Streptantibioticus silvisoli]MDI5961240.1 beta-ketoacyl-[acyl-carrier-protein] synthase family protein [Streptantibioticus silvisoli]MDI5971042.1 beta-ketoacyl-[acyl-carrier-protein] synthase family protein [Streptantibioticus silvisoli]
MNRPGATVTGLGVVTPVGRKPAEFFDALLTGRSGLVRPPDGHPAAGWLESAGIAPAVDPLEVLPPKEGRCVDRFVLMALAAAEDALADSGIVVGRDVDPYRVAVVVSSGGAGLQTFEEQSHRRLERGRPGVSPYLLPGMLANMASARIAIRHGIRGYSSAVSTACAAGAQSIAEGLRLLRAGDADVVVCGGSESSLHPTIASAFANTRALASGWQDPAQASRPFDERRNGFVLGEGAAVLVLERTDFAAARGATGYADLIGWGATTDAHHPTSPRPDGEGAAACVRRAIDDAGLAPGDIDHVNAHGTGTKLGDRAETAALHTVFGDTGPAVSSVKGNTGHLLGASGAVEAVATVLSVAHGVLPPTANLDAPAPDCELDHVRAAPRHTRVRAALSNSFAFGGHNISLLFGPAGTAAPRVPEGDTP